LYVVEFIYISTMGNTSKNLILHLLHFIALHQTFMAKYRTQKVGQENIRYLHKGRGNPLVFLHGFGGRPSYYLSLLNLLSENFEIIAPEVYGINYLKQQPISINEYAELTLGFCSSLGVDHHCMVGHSMGGAVAFRIGNNVSDHFYLIGINPVLPVDYGLLGFTARATYKSIRESLGITGGLRAILLGNTVPIPAILNLLRNMGASIDAVSDICNLTYQNMNVTQPTLILYGEKDEFFILDEGITRQIKDSFDRVTIKRLSKLNHDWLIFYPELAAQEISNFCSSGYCTSCK